MANSNYQAGVRLERDIMELWRERGYSVVRTAGSHGQYDVVAYRSDRVAEFIQCKRVSTESERNRLLKEFKRVTEPSRYFHQTLAVKIKGSSEIFEWTI